MYSETYLLWNKLGECCTECGISFNRLDEICGLQRGMTEFMQSNDLYPPNEIMRRYSLFCGLSEAELMGQSDEAPVEVPRNIFVVKNADCIKHYYDMESVLGRLCIDVASNDMREYVGVVVEDNSMEDARIFEGDVAVVRRQAIAEDGDIVVARIGEDTVIRRYFRKKDVVWIKPQGLCDSEFGVVTDFLGNIERKIQILGKVIYTMRFFEEI